MGYSEEKSIGSWGAKYRSYLEARVGSETESTATIKGKGGGQTKWVDAWSGSSISFSGGDNYSYSTSGDCYANPFSNSGWDNTNWWWNDFTYEVVDKTHSSRTLTYEVKFNYGGAGNATATAEVTVAAKTSYTISYTKNSTYNGYTDSTVSNLPNNQTKWYGESLTLSSTKPTKADTTANGPTVTLNYNYTGSTNDTLTPTDTYSYTFSKWNTSSNGSGTNYTAGSSYTSNSANTLYAIWNRTKSAGSVTLPTPTRSGFTFLGWSTTSSASTGTYSGGSSYTPSSAIILYAIWRANLGTDYILKATSKSDTWESLIDNQNVQGSTLYEAGGQYNGWGIDSFGFVTCFGIKIERGAYYVRGTDKPIRGETYRYFDS